MAGSNTMPGQVDTRSYDVKEALRDRTAIQIRAIRRDDKSRLLEHFAGLSAQSRYFRFFGQKRELTSQDLTRFTELDFDRHVGIAATLHQDDRERFIGVARYVRTQAPSRAEIALAVLDEYQGAGVGPLLIRHLARIAHDNGITEFEADVRGDNSRMLAVLARSGCIINHAADAGVVHFMLKCPEVSPPTSKNEFNHADRHPGGPKGDNHGGFLC
jgi:RimJ/RimL family protein N-acetyltransferase